MKAETMMTVANLASRHAVSAALYALCIFCLLPSAAKSADFILSGGHFFTADPNHPDASAIVIKDKDIIFVGRTEQAMAYRRADTRVIDTSGKMVLPGFHDAHVHPLLGGRSLLGCDLSSAEGLDDLTAMLKTCMADSEAAWLVAEGLNLGFFSAAGPTLDWLDSISASKPLLLRASDGHSVSLNSSALAAAGITRETRDPPAGLIERDELGKPSGTLRESAMAMAEQKLPAVNREEQQATLLASIREMNRFGITSIFDAWVGSKDIAAYQALESRGQLSLRVRAALAYGHGDLFVLDSPETYESLLLNRKRLRTDRFDLAAVKLFIDGVLEGETAALLTPYLHKPGYRGKFTYKQDDLNRTVAEFTREGVQVYTHAIGDGGVRAILDAVEFAQGIHGKKDLRHHISHLQLIHPDDHARFGELGVVANFQALWAQPDEWIINLNLPVVGLDRVHRMYPIASIAKSGGKIVGGSDWSGSSWNPLDAIEVAVLRQDWIANDGLDNESLTQLDVLNRQERVNIDTMLRAYTINAAWSMHQEDQTGSLTPGKRADVIVLSENLFDIPPQRISTVKVELTMIDGKEVYSHD